MTWFLGQFRKHFSWKSQAQFTFRAKKTVKMQWAPNHSSISLECQRLPWNCEEWTWQQMTVRGHGGSVLDYFLVDFVFEFQMFLAHTRVNFVEMHVEFTAVDEWFEFCGITGNTSEGDNCGLVRAIYLPLRFHEYAIAWQKFLQFLVEKISDSGSICLKYVGRSEDKPSTVYLQQVRLSSDSSHSLLRFERDESTD